MFNMCASFDHGNIKTGVKKFWPFSKMSQVGLRRGLEMNYPIVLLAVISKL